MKLSELLIDSKTEYEIKGNADIEISDITFDSRKAKDGVMFFCLIGAAVDGHDYAMSAYDNGCRVFAVCKGITLPSDTVVVKFENTRSAMPHVAASFFGHPASKLRMIGITGTKGKTSIATMIYRCLEACNLKCGNIGTSGIEYDGIKLAAKNTTPESLELHRILADMVHHGVKVCIMEVSSQALFNYRVDGIDFLCGVYTNLSPDHIGPTEHPNFEHYKNCKKKLFSMCRYGILNADDPYFADIACGSSCEVISYGLNQKSDYTAENVKPYKTGKYLGMSFDAMCRGKRTLGTIPFPGKYSVLNTLAVLAVCDTLGVNITTAMICMRDIQISGRFETFPMFDDRLFVIDYAHNEGSMKNLLESVKSYKPKRLVVVFGSIGDRTQNRRVGLGSVCNELADFSIITSDNPGCEDPNKIIDEIATYFSSESKYVKIADRKEAIIYAVENSRPGDVVLLCGKGHEDYQIVGKEKVHFSEKEILAEIKSKMN